jgi:hypothetical protein
LLYAIAFHRSPFDLPDTNLGGSIGKFFSSHLKKIYIKTMFDDFTVFDTALAVISGKYDIPASNRYSKGFIALIAAMLQVLFFSLLICFRTVLNSVGPVQSKLEDRPFVPAIAARVESMLREHGVSISTPKSQRSEFDSDDESESLTGVKLDMRT